tara:strand:- start:96 stop:455 length:360 start_codon:yes stop_codon:yes gene_type:complete
MLTFIKQIFTWWNHQTLGTRIYTLIFGKLKGKDYFGNKYYQNKSGKRWVVYNGEVDATKIPNEWFSWMHYLNNKIEHDQELKKFSWQKQSVPNQTGTIKAYHPNKDSTNDYKKYKSWKE